MNGEAIARPLVVAAVLLAGCGSHRAGELAAADRVAFYQLATIDGLVRSRAVIVLEHGTPRISFADLADARRRLAALAPGDPGLKALRNQLSAALAAVGGRRAGSARAALASTDSVYLGLLRYQRKHPAVGGVIPD